MMKTRQIALLLVLFMLSALMAFADGANDYQLSTGFKTVATPTLSLTNATSTIIGTIPTLTSEVTVIASGASINYGPIGVSSSTMYPFIADGAVLTFTHLATRKPTIYFCVRGATSTGAIGFVAK